MVGYASNIASADRPRRSGYYRWRMPRLATPVEIELRDELQQVAVEWPAYGYRRIAAELRRRGLDVNQHFGLDTTGDENVQEWA